MALLYKIVPTFQNTWIEYFSDLAQYCIAIEDKDLHGRENWVGIIYFWYSKVANRSPSVGHLYHYLAILARPNIL